MNKEVVGIFLPVRLGSSRVVNKNTRPFSTYKNGLLELKLRQLVLVENVRIYLSTNDPICNKIVHEIDPENKVIQIINRPNELCLDTTPLSELISYVPSIIKDNHILWTHVTSPFINNTIYSTAIKNYFKCLDEGYDSLMTVKKLQEFLWSAKKNDFISFDRKKIKWPRTQDIDPIFSVNSGIFLTSRNIYLSGDRIGSNPFLFELDFLSSIDIDWQEDFEIAEILFNQINK